ncbi:hypothetical protein GCM10009540_25620 [Streptomyces turgidiscabies]
MPARAVQEGLRPRAPSALPVRLPLRLSLHATRAGKAGGPTEPDARRDPPQPARTGPGPDRSGSADVAAQITYTPGK